MKSTLSRILSLVLFLLCVPSCSAKLPPSIQKETECASWLTPTEDMGQEYLDSFLFFGESTTYHMKDREVLRGGKDTKQILAPDSGTVNLDHTTKNIPLRDPETGEHVTIGEALSKKCPERLILTFGLNGAVQKVKRGEDYYKGCYRSLLDCIREASPKTKILLQSAFPVAKNMDMSRYSISVEELNQNLDQINEWTHELAEEYSIGYLNTSEILKDENGYLKFEYQNGDGHHLTREAYLEILYYIRTHGYE